VINPCDRFVRIRPRMAPPETHQATEDRGHASASAVPVITLAVGVNARELSPPSVS
jgi:hypothetical protein